MRINRSARESKECFIFFRQVDPSGPLATLRKLLLSDESLATFKRWMSDHWYAAALIVLGAISLLVRIRHFFLLYLKKKKMERMRFTIVPIYCILTGYYCSSASSLSYGQWNLKTGNLGFRRFTGNASFPVEK